MKQTILNLFGELTEAKQIIASYHRRTALLSEELASVLAGQSWPWSVHWNLACTLLLIVQVLCCTVI